MSEAWFYALTACTTIYGTYAPHTTCLGYSGPIISLGPYRHLIRHALDTVDLFYPWALIGTSYDMPEIQWAHSIPSLTHGDVYGNRRPGKSASGYSVQLT